MNRVLTQDALRFCTKEALRCKGRVACLAQERNATRIQAESNRPQDQFRHNDLCRKWRSEPDDARDLTKHRPLTCGPTLGSGHSDPGKETVATHITSGWEWANFCVGAIISLV